MNLNKKTSSENTHVHSEAMLSSLKTQLGRLFVEPELRLLSNAMSEADRASLDLTIDQVVEMAVGRLHGECAGADRLRKPNFGPAASLRTATRRDEKNAGWRLAVKEKRTFL